jgi:hypothetical protein
MENMQSVAFKRAINVLNALKCQFAIITPEGEKFGELEVSKPTNIRKHKMGELKTYVEQFVASVEVGQNFTVPCGDYDMETIATSVGNWFYKKYGAGSLNYQSDRQANAIHGFRSI